MKNYSTYTKGFGLKLLQRILDIHTDKITLSLKKPEYWVIPNGETQPSQFLTEGLQRIELSLSINLEASHRLVIDSLLMELLFNLESKPQLKLRLEEKFSFESDILEDGRFVQITQEPDYTMFYTEGEPYIIVIY